MERRSTTKCREGREGRGRKWGLLLRAGRGVEGGRRGGEGREGPGPPW